MLGNYKRNDHCSGVLSSVWMFVPQPMVVVPQVVRHYLWESDWRPMPMIDPPHLWCCTLDRSQLMFCSIRWSEERIFFDRWNIDMQFSLHRRASVFGDTVLLVGSVERKSIGNGEDWCMNDIWRIISTEQCIPRRDSGSSLLFGKKLSN